MRSLLVLLLALVVVPQIVFAQGEEEDEDLQEEENYVIEGDSTNWDEITNTDGIVLVMFYAPWCGHSKRFSPEFEEASRILKDEVLFVAVNGEQETSLKKQYKIDSYPKILSFIHGEETNYEGGRHTDEILTWVKKHSVPAMSLLNNEEELSKFKNHHEVVTVAFLKKGSKEITEWEQFCASHRMNHLFGLITDEKLAAKEGVSLPALIVYKDFDERKDIADKFDLSTALDFITASSFRLFAEIKPSIYKSYIERKLPIAWLFVDGEQEKDSEYAKAAVADIAKEYKGKLSMVWVDGVKNTAMAHRLGLSGLKWPAFGIDDEGEHFDYNEDKVIGSDDFKGWLSDFINGALSPTVKSEPIPSNPVHRGLTTVVGDTFQDIVYNTDHDVLIRFHSPRDGHSKHCEQAFHELADAYRHQDNIIIADIDATKNDAPKKFKWQHVFPTIVLIKKGTNEIVNYDGKRDLESMDAFMRENCEVIDKPVNNK
eukprot:TRINITY_DN1200_c2_g2_i1.p1 TRINITY_DN1200_c2_g2~~TRINITY_DN1200_c2_g2_i1.p1  ORF type:complete len:485 (+),score=117.15 TRINITY_DN1200_c2_g2_i1:49-1503(+)